MPAQSSTPSPVSPWPLHRLPTIADPVPATMLALTLHRDQYGAPARVLRAETVATPVLRPEDAGRVLVAVLATGPNFNTNFAALGLPVPVFGKGDAADLHIPGSDAVGVVVATGAAVTRVKVGQAVILDSWTGQNIRGYETHDGFHAQFTVVDELRALPVPEELGNQSPEQLAAVMLAYGTAYRAVVERLDVKPGDSLLVMGGGKGTSFAGAQLGKLLGARVILVGSNPQLGASLIERGFADVFIDRRGIPATAFGPIETGESEAAWRLRSQPFRDQVFAANNGRPVDRVFEHTGGGNFPLLHSVLAEGGSLAFFGATGQGLRGEYRETFFYAGRRQVMDARWVWMRQKLVLCRTASPAAILAEIRLPPGRRGLIWGADAYALEFAEAALARGCSLAVLVSFSAESAGMARLRALGVPERALIDTDRFALQDDMPDPLTADGTPSDAYQTEFLVPARALGKAIWDVFGGRNSPDFVVERPDQSRLHYSTFLLRDHNENDDLPSGYVLMRGPGNCSILGSHMYRSTQAAATLRLLASGGLSMEPEDLEVGSLEDLPELQQKMLEGRMSRPKGVALVQADRAGRSIREVQDAFLGESLLRAAPGAGRYLDVRLAGGIALLTLTRPAALNALSEALIQQLGQLVEELAVSQTIEGRRVEALILTGAGRSFVAGADIEVFVGKTAAQLERLALDNMAVFSRIERLPLPVISLIDGFALGGGNELAMSTAYRIVTDNAQLGQPEVKLGIIPGYGGMQRLPRLIGPRRALEMAVNGEPVDGRTAVSLGLAHEYCGSAAAISRAFQVAREFQRGERRLSPPDWNAAGRAQAAELKALGTDPAVRPLRAAARPGEAEAGELVAARRYAARVALQALEEGYGLDFDAGLANDARLFAEVVTSPSGQAWCRRFLAKDPAQSSFLQQLQPAD